MEPCGWSREQWGLRRDPSCDLLAPLAFADRQMRDRVTKTVAAPDHPASLPSQGRD